MAFFGYLFLVPGKAFAIIQQPEDKNATVNSDLGKVNDAFQEYFFEALKQRGIENYRKSNEALQKCLSIDDSKAVIYYEMAKNFYSLEEFEKAQPNFQKALDRKPKDENILRDFYENEIASIDYESAIKLLQKLIKIDNKYREDLADLYILSDRYDNALSLIDSLDNQYGKNEYRTRLRRQIYARTNNTDAQIASLETAIEDNPEEEQNYLNLIYVYSDEGREEEAFETAQELLEYSPGSSLAHLALYKFYLNKDQPEQAMQSMQMVFKSEEIDAASKYKVLNDFLLFVNQNPEWEGELMEVSQMLSKLENEPSLYRKLGEYYLKSDNKADALRYFEMGLKEDPANFEMIKNTLILRIDMERFEGASELAAEAKDIFPAQPIFYLLNGVALNKLKNYSEAVEILTFGLDFLIENPRMEADFYQQIAVSYAGMEDKERANEYKAKAIKILKEATK
ncbi:Tetratricopeptide repeat-containing protein [Zunongwangia mangrovi]|uniref:Tetratricopeptide repeat-containing protein n=1 Tax=Zunongwangia mangrovi TaxID=1334022 RepID=A0A1I1DQ47_9FLAO|nr:Tetratricopeptide repeat-containing protein [Zunongwangia mangrovi]